MGYIGSDPKTKESVSTSQLIDDSVTNAKIVDDIQFNSVTSSVVSASSNIIADTFSGTFSGALSSSAQIGASISGSFTSPSASLSTRMTAVEAGSTSKTLVSSSVLSSPSQGTIRLATNGVNTDVDSGLQSSDSPTFAGVTVTGTLTAQEIHTEFESASILFTSGSTIFGNSSDDIHNMTGSLNVSGGLSVKDGALTVTDNVDFNGDLDVDGTTNLDNTDIDGTLTVDGGNIVFNEDSADQDFRVESNGQTHMLFVDGGNNRVGIGISNPSYPLVVSDGGGLGFEFSPDHAGGGYNMLQNYNRAGSAYVPIYYVATDHRFFNGGTETLTISGSGHVIVPQGTLEVGQHGVAGGQIVSDGDLSIHAGFNDSSTGNGDIIFKRYGDPTSAEELARFTSTGRLGIGIASPDDLLDIQGGNLRVRVGGAGAIHLQNDGSNHSQILANNNGGTTTVQLKTSGDSFLNGGHLGLGATPSNPGGMNKQLEVTSTSDVQIAMRATADLSGDARIGDLTWITNHGSNPQVAMIQGRVANGDEDRGQISFHTRNTESGGAPTERMRLTNVGLLGIGTTGPDALLHLRADTNNDRMLHLEHTHSADRLKLGLTHPSQQFVIANNGSHFIFTNESTSTDHFKMAADGTLTATDTSIGAISDEKTKQNIQTYSGSLSVINTLRPVTYEWKSDRKKDGIQRGFIAQEVTSSDAYWVQSSSVDPHEPDWEYLDGTQQLNTISGSRSALVSKLNDKDTLYVSAIQELTQAVRDLRAMITGSTDLGQLKAFVSGSSFV